VLIVLMERWIAPRRQAGGESLDLLAPERDLAHGRVVRQHGDDDFRNRNTSARSVVGLSPSASSVPICCGRRTQAITRWPAAARFLAMAVPIRPSPTNPISPAVGPRLAI